ncbi:hypothetical protein ACQKQD_18640 [Methylobacterium sp. NPDC080182]|uniref:hypothetical protein n=1 Tax=Methylobacterium sp. NPDC080182 TaxID=3390590 RepID=UPI003CFCFCAF
MTIMMKRLAAVLGAALLAAAPSGALAQSSPNFSYGQVPTAKQWNDAFSSKQDRLTFAPLNPAGGTMQGKLQTAPSTVNAAGLTLQPGTSPSVPANGDIWTTSVGLYSRVGGRTLALPGLDQSTGALLVPGGPTLGTYQSGQFTSQPYALQIGAGGATGPVGGASVTLPSGAAVSLTALANPTTSPLVSKFRAIVATYDDFASVGDGLPWAASADVCPAINAAFAYLIGAGGGTFVPPPGVANCATPLRGSNLSKVKVAGQGSGAFGIAGTELKWTGAVGAIMLDLRATTPQVPVTAVGLQDFTLNANGRAKTGLYVRGLKNSKIDIMVRNSTGPGVDIDVDEAKGPLVTGQLTGTVWSSYTVGSGGTNGTYTNVPLVSAAGADSGGATADVTIAGGSVSNIVIKAGGHDYVLNEALSIAPASIGGTTGVTIIVGNCGNASTSFLDTSQNEWKLRVTQQGTPSLAAKGVVIGAGSPWLDTNSSQWLNVLTLTQQGTGFEVGNADTNEFIFTRADRDGSTGIAVDLLGGRWGLPSSSRANRFGTMSATAGLVARGGAQPSTRNVVAKYNTESGETFPSWEPGATINVTDDQGYPIGNTGFTVNQVRTAYTPTVARGTTAATTATASADYRRFGREILGIRLTVQVTGGTGYIKASLPCTPYRNTTLSGYDAATGFSVQGRIGSGDPSAYIYNYDGSTPQSANSQTILTGDLECAN